MTKYLKLTSDIISLILIIVICVAAVDQIMSGNLINGVWLFMWTELIIIRDRVKKND